MNIYVDFDDCLCETARHFSGLVYTMFKKKIPYEDIDFFDLQKSFSLNDDQFESMMTEANALYAEGKVEEAQSMFDQISELNKELQGESVGMTK